MIQAYFNGTRLHIDEHFAIGITFENFNISDIANRKISRTNAFNIPKQGNEITFEFASQPNPPGDFPYNDYDFDLIADGVYVYQNGRAWIVSENDNYYTLMATNHKNVIDLMKSIPLSGMFPDPIALDAPASLSPLFHTGINGFKIDPLFHDDADYPLEGTTWTPSDDYNHYPGVSYLSIFVKTIFEKFETDQSYRFDGNLWTDSTFEDVRIPMAQAMLFLYDGDSDVSVDEITIHESFTFFDLFKLILQVFAATFKVSGTTITIQKLSDLEITAPLDWSGKVERKSKNFAVPNMAQKNYMRYDVDVDVDQNAYAGIFDCNNANIEFEKEHDKIIAKIFKERELAGFYSNASSDDLSGIVLAPYKGIRDDAGGTYLRKSGLSDLCLILTGNEYLGQPLDITIVYWEEYAPGSWTFSSYSDTLTSDAQTKAPIFIDMSTYYSWIETNILTDPEFYEASLHLNIVDILSFDPLTAVKIKELGGLFYVNIIRNFLISSHNRTTPVELIKID